MCCWMALLFFFSSRRRHTRWTGDWSSDVCSSDLVGIVGLDDEPLAAVVHAQAQRGPAALDELHAEKVFAETRPILEVAGAQPDIAERLQCHVRLLIAGSVRVPRLLYRIRPVPLRAFHRPGSDRAPPCPKS